MLNFNNDFREDQSRNNTSVGSHLLEHRPYEFVCGLIQVNFPSPSKTPAWLEYLEYFSSSIQNIYFRI